MSKSLIKESVLPEKNNSRWTWLVLGIGGAVRILVMFVASVRPSDLSTDFIHQILPATSNLIAGHGFTVDGVTPWAWKGPLFPLFVAVFLLLFDGNFWPLRFTMVFLDFLCIALVMKIGERAFNRQTGILAGFLWAFYIPSCWLASILNYEVIATVLLLVSFMMLLAWGLRNWVWASIAGFILSLVTSCRASTFFLGPFFLLLGLIQPMKDRKALRNLFFFALFSILGVMPWTLRNFVHFRTVVPVAISWPDHLFWGSEKAFLTETQRKYELVHKRLEELGFGALSDDPLARAGEMKAATMRNYARQWRENPLILIDLYITKFYKIFFYTDSGRWDWALMVLNFPIVLLCFAGIRNLRGRWSEGTSILFATMLYFWLFHMPFHTFFRFMLPAWPLFILFAAHAFFGKEESTRRQVLKEKETSDVSIQQQL